MQRVKHGSWTGVLALTIVAACNNGGDGGGGGSGGNATGGSGGVTAGRGGSAGGGSGGGSAGQGGSGGSAGQAGSGGASAGQGGTGGGGAGQGGTAGGGAGMGGAAGMAGAAGGMAGMAGAMGGMVASSGFCPAGQTYTLQLPANPKATLVKGGLRGAEGPVWVDSENALFFSEIHRDGANYTQAGSTTISKLVGTTMTEWVAASGSNGLSLIKLEGKWQILAATHDKEELSVYDVATKARTTYVDKYMAKSFNSPNDLAVRGDGTVYFSDPNWQAAGRAGQGATRVYRVAPGDKAVSIVDANLNQPNGVSLSQDDKYLYVSSIDGNGRVTRYEINADGSTKAGTTFKQTMGQYPDGMTVDCAGNVYVTSSMGVEVYANAQDAGKLIVVGSNQGATNVAFGGADHKTLFITSEGNDKAVYSITLNVPGLPY